MAVADPFLYYTNTYKYRPVVPVASKYAIPAAYYNPYNTVPIAEAEKLEDKAGIVASTPTALNVPQYYSQYAAFPTINPVLYKSAPSYYAQSGPGVVHQVAKREAVNNAQLNDDASEYEYPTYGYHYGSVYPSAYKYEAYPAMAMSRSSGHDYGHGK